MYMMAKNKDLAREAKASPNPSPNKVFENAAKSKTPNVLNPFHNGYQGYSDSDLIAFSCLIGPPQVACLAALSEGFCHDYGIAKVYGCPGTHQHFTGHVRNS